LVRLGKIRAKAVVMSDTNEEGLLKAYFERLSAGLVRIPIDQLALLAAEIKKIRSNGNTVWICGNGGSAATASHMQVDLSFGVKPGVKARALTDNSASLTATGNDVSFDEVFSRQLTLEAEKGDLLLVISASGNSENLLRAVESAKAKGLSTAAFLGFDGGKLLGQVEIPILTRTIGGDYGVAEDIHGSLNHALKELLNGGLPKK
jgi:D-sedoheptulose 7-phosphate isomerase